MTTSISLHPRVLELMASRVCHDLVSPVGAVNNGVELMEELGAAAGAEATQLISSSAQQASIRLKVFRLCYGAAGTDKNVGFKDIRDAFVDLVPSGGRIKVEFEGDIGLAFSMPPQGFFKVLLNVMILAEECLHGEGMIGVAALPDKSGVKVSVAGKNAAFRDGVEAAFTGDTAADDLDARSVHAYLTGRFAAHFGLSLVTEKPTDGGRLDFILSV